MMAITSLEDVKRYLIIYCSMEHDMDVAEHPLHKAAYREVYKVINTFLKADMELRFLKKHLSYHRGITDNKYCKEELRKISESIKGV